MKIRNKIRPHASKEIPHVLTPIDNRLVRQSLLLLIKQHAHSCKINRHSNLCLTEKLNGF